MEVWKNIPGYEGRYQVSKQGRVRSVDHYVRCGKNGAGTRLVKGRVLRPGVCLSGHVSVALGKGNSKMVHALVLLAFKGAPPKGYECGHRNGVPADNRLSNLRYITRAENIRDVVRHGNRKVSMRDVRCIRRSSAPARVLAEKFGVSRSFVQNIRTGVNYAGV